MSDERFRFHLARELHWGSVARMGGGMSAREFALWRVFYEVEAEEAENEKG